MTEQRWYVASLNKKKLQNWALVTEQIVSRGFEGFVPVARRAVFYYGSMVYVHTPLFPGYILVKFAADPYTVQRVNHTQGVGSLLPLGHEHPTALPLDFVEELKARPLIQDVKATILRFAKYELVKIISGAFAGQTGWEVESASLTNARLRNIVSGKIVTAPTSALARV